MNDDHIRPAPGRLQGTAPPARPPYARSHRRRGAPNLPRFALLLAVGFLVAGCETAPEEVRALEARSTEAIANYDANAVLAVEALLAAYREASRRELALVSREDVRQTARDFSYTNEAGEIVALRGVSESEAVAFLATYRLKLDAIEEVVGGFRAGWDEARGDYVEAMALREELYRWLSREGIQPEHIDAIGRALADAIEKRGRP